MSLSDAFIRRRTSTLLVAMGALMLGIAAYFALPVAPLPQTEFPTIQVQAQLPGASADTMATSVAAPLERNFSLITGLSEMTSSSSLGTMQIVLVFDLNKPLAEATQDVQTAISASAGNLPRNLPNPPIYHKVNPADFTILSLTLTSETLPLTDLSRLADDVVSKQLGRLPGVGMIDYNGERRPAVRVELDPDRVAALGLTLDDVRQVIAQQTVNAPKGSLDAPDTSLLLDATDQLVDADAYRSMVVATRNGSPVRLSDLGTVTDAAEDVRDGAWMNGKPAIVIDIHKQPGYNVVRTVEGVRKALPGLIALLPPAARLSIVGDHTETIRSSVRDVQLTMLMTVVLVVLVIYFFLQNLRATIIASVAIPLSIVVTFAVMWVLGYSLDNLSLMALTIAVSFVVDDAIVVIENVARHLEMGAGRLDAAMLGAREILFTIISMTASLIAVFIPILFMGGIIGRLFREFAVTVSIALVISAIISLTLTPMLCAWLLDHVPVERQTRFQREAERFFERVMAGYRRSLDWVLERPVPMLLVTLLTLFLTAVLYVEIPKGFFPEQDTGLIQASTEAAPDVGYELMARRMQQAGAIISADPAVDNVYYWIGPVPTLSQGRMNINLKPHSQRSDRAPAIVARLRRKLASVIGLDVHMVVRQDIQIGGRPSKTQYQYTLQGADVAELTHWASILQARLASQPALSDISSDAEAEAAAATLDIDRTTASRLGVSVQAIDDTLYDAFGQRQVAILFTQLNQYHVVMGIDPRFQLSTAALDHLYARSSITGKLVPLSLIARIVPGTLPITLNHQGGYPSITLSFNLAPGYSLGDAVTQVEAIEARLGMPPSIHGSFSGTAAAFRASLASQPWLILAALIAVYIVLGILYESVIHPFTIISTLPSAGLGALLALMLFGQQLSIMAMIGILLLIGIVKKNAIMMIDFAIVAEREGLPTRDAIKQGAVLRFRPIMMTTMAALFGALPLALGLGAGAELRVPLGIAIAGGLIVSQALTLYATPVIYLWLDRLRLYFASASAQMTIPRTVS